MDDVLVCNYCGKVYSKKEYDLKALTNHSRMCEKHPLHEAELIIRKLRSALAAVVGSDIDDELKAMMVAACVMPVPEIDRTIAVNAMQALLDTTEYRTHTSLHTEKTEYSLTGRMCSGTGNS